MWRASIMRRARFAMSTTRVPMSTRTLLVRKYDIALSNTISYYMSSSALTMFELRGESSRRCRLRLVENHLVESFALGDQLGSAPTGEQRSVASVDALVFIPPDGLTMAVVRPKAESRGYLASQTSARRDVTPIPEERRAPRRHDNSIHVGNERHPQKCRSDRQGSCRGRTHRPFRTLDVGVNAYQAAVTIRSASARICVGSSFVGYSCLNYGDPL